MKRPIIIILIAVIISIGFYIGYRQAISPIPIFPRKSKIPSESDTTIPQSFDVDSTTSIGSNSPDFNKEKAQQMYKELQELKAQGKYELMRVEERPNGTKYYIYQFKLSNGQVIAWGSPTPFATP
jgi:hypothetical protein